MSSDPALAAQRRRITAAAPGPETEELRKAYLDVLKLALCDLAGAGTSEVRWTDDKRWFSRELVGDDQYAGRAEGKDFVLNGLTMVGLRRLDGLQRCVESVVRDGVEGDLIEAGVWRGGASILIRATLDSLGATDRLLWLADSFEGFPAPGQDDLAADHALKTDISGIEFLAPGLGTVQSYFARFGLEQRVRFIPGFFQDTLRHLGEKQWALIRADADTYEATKYALEMLYPGLALGGYLVLDDYFHPWLPQCRQAVDEFRADHGVTEPIEQVDWNGGHWRREDKPPQTEASQSADPESVVASAPAPVKAPPHIRTDRELQLSSELAEMRERLEAAQVQLERLTSSPFAGARSWLGRALRRESG